MHKRQRTDMVLKEHGNHLGGYLGGMWGVFGGIRGQFGGIWGIRGRRNHDVFHSELGTTDPYYNIKKK